MTGKKIIILFSGGLDSRLIIKMMQEQNMEILALFFQFPFGKSNKNKNASIEFAKKHEFKLRIIDCTKGKLLQEYLEVIKKAKHGRGKSINPCIDCKIFMLKKAKEIADTLKIKTIVTGEVLSQRPMSQMKSKMLIIEEEAKLKGNILRPLSAKILEETKIEKDKIIDREKLSDVHGRQRTKQIALAKKYKIDYPDPAGGCVLCEKMMKNRFELIFKRGIEDEELKLVTIGRQFKIKNAWVITGRDKSENDLINSLENKTREIITSDSLDLIGPDAIILNAEETEKIKITNETREIIIKIINAYSKNSEEKDRKEFEKFKL